MKILFIFLLVLLAAMGVGFLIHEDPGSVVLSYHHWVITTTLWVAAVSLIIAFVVFYFIVRVFKNIAGIPAAIKRRKKLACAQEYQHDIMHGVVELAKGELKNFNKSKSVDKNNRYANYLLAAKAAHWSRDYHSRDRYLKTALTINPEAHFDIELSQAQFYLDSDQVDD